MKKIIIAAAGIVILGGGAYALTRNSGKKDSSPDNTFNTTQKSAVADTSDNKISSTTIIYNGSNFSPSTLTIKAGTTVKVVNNSNSELQFDSDPHPAHTSNPELNVGSVEPGQSAKFTANTTGTYGYHNHGNPSQTGTLVVE